MSVYETQGAWENRWLWEIDQLSTTDFFSTDRSSRTYRVVLGEYDLTQPEGPEQAILINAGDFIVHPRWNSNCLACG